MVLQKDTENNGKILEKIEKKQHIFKIRNS